ncbi:uncharacterized protein LOC143869826 [Tasmannia lanceolata]|uniref:uncharacterized protein LOC143869826 n=1 Tax=Tasmannia lanceolata TaxID=3420 RepID=UPI004064AFC4
MNFGSLQGLNFLSFDSSQVGSRGKLNDLNFLTSLTNCSSLEWLSLATNYISGVLPNSIANLSTQLIKLTLGRNQIYGSIPLGIENLVSLTALGMEENSLTGTIPIGIGKLNKLIQLSLSRNELFGQLPPSFGNISQLSGLDLHGNNLEGSIPSGLRKLEHMQGLYLYNNNLSGIIPMQILKLSSLSQGLNLSYNSFTGSQASEVGNLNQLGELDISFNNLSSEILDMLGNCVSLENLFIGHNFLHGMSPSSLSSLKGIPLSALKGILVIDLPHNKLSGKIPKYLEKFDFLDYGSVYKGILDNNQIAIVLKVLNLQQRGAYKSFDAECEALRNMWHRNLVRVLTSCSSIDFHGSDFRALVFEYMPNGNLEN